MIEKPASAPMGLGLRDILYVIFRHKWKISLISAAGVGGAILLYFLSPLTYQSDAKLMVRYILDNRAPVQGPANDRRIKAPSESGGDSIVNDEVEILTSFDLAQQVVEKLKLQADLVAKLGGRTNALQAAMAIQKGLHTEVNRRSAVVHLIFKHGDPLVAQPVLKQIIDTYLARQAEIHSAAGLYDDYLTRQRDELRSRLSTVQEDLRKAKERAGSIFSLDDTKKAYADQVARIRQAILDVDAELAERKAAVKALTELLPTNSASAATLASVVNTPALTNANNAPATNTPPPVASEKEAEYRRLLGLIERLGKQDQDLRLQFTPENRMVKNIQEQIVNAEKLKRKLEEENPGLLATKAEGPKALPLAPPPATSAASSGGSIAHLNILAEAAKIPALESKIRVLTNQLSKIRAESAALSADEGTIADLELTRKTLEGQLNSFQKALDDLHADEQLGAARTSNIIPIQNPSPATRSPSKRMQMMAMVVFCCFGLAFGLAFGLEFYLDPSIKRPIEVETRLHLPLFLAIPQLTLNGNGKSHGRLWGRSKVPLLPAASGQGNGGLTATSGDSGAENGEDRPEAAGLMQGATDDGQFEGVTRSVDLPPLPRGHLEPWDPRHKMRPFCEALRDRLITFFEVNSLTHKPKLVAITSCSEGTGVSTIAASVAASLSETGDGNVLLVDMSNQGDAHEFYRGRLACGLEAALEAETRGQAFVQNNLYVVSESPNSDRLPQALPKRFKHLVPRLKASDYDYIIFDMPPVSQISITTRLARFMDMVLIVAESEKTDRSVLQHASAMLTASKANVGVVVNKTKSYVPRRLLQEL